MNLQEQASKRKERLKALRDRQQKESNGEPDKKKHASDDAISSLPKPVFRSYKPQAETLKESVLPEVKPADVTATIQTQLEAAKDDKVADEIDLVNLAPRKPDWDLKRDIAKKLAKLEKRTQRAIAELMRERLSSKKGDDLVTVVNAGAAAAELDR